MTQQPWTHHEAPLEHTLEWSYQGITHKTTVRADSIDNLWYQVRSLMKTIKTMIERDQMKNGTTPTGSQGSGRADFCNIHQVEMTWRKAKDGSGHGWFSHKVGSDWCRGGKEAA